MMEWMKKHDMLAKVFSILAAILLWMYVVDEQNPDITQTYSNIGVQIVGLEKLEDSGLTIIEGASSVVSVQVKGKRNNMVQMSKDKIEVAVNVSTIPSPGEYNLSYLASADVAGITISSKNPTQIRLVVDKIASKSVPVKLDLKGQMPEGYLMDDYVVEPDAVTVKGPQSVLDQIAYAHASYDISAVKQSTTTTLSYTLIDSEGKEVDMKFLTMEDPAISVTIPVHQAGKIPLLIDLEQLKGIPESAVSYTIEPANIEVKGLPEDISTLNSIKLGTVSVEDLIRSGKTEVTLPIILPNGITTDEKTTTAKVKFTFSGIGDKTIIVGAQQFAAEAGFHFETSSLNIKVIGDEKVLAKLKPEDFQISFDASKITDSGTHTVDAIIKYSGEDAFFMPDSYKVTVVKES